jgi:solute carrier family 50 protein (sugar transporter)
METWQEYVGWAATCLTMCFYISPVIPFINVCRGQITYEQTPSIIIVTAYINCFCWYIYGDMIFSDQIKICNLIGAGSSLILICIYLLYEIKHYTLDAILNALIILTGSVSVYRGFTLVIDDNSIIGKICVVTALIVFLSPLQIIYKVIKDKTYFLIPVYTAIVSLFSTGCWIIYGLSLKDLNIIFPNIIGMILGVVQIVIYYNYKRRYGQFGDRDTNRTIGIETQANDEIKRDENKNDEGNNQNDIKEKQVEIVEKVDN